jgi:DNA replication protein DnaC
MMRELKNTDLLILDDWGMAVFDPLSGRDLLEVVEDRFGYRSTVISGQLPVSGTRGQEPCPEQPSRLRI